MLNKWFKDGEAEAWRIITENGDAYITRVNKTADKFFYEVINIEDRIVLANIEPMVGLDNTMMIVENLLNIQSEEA